MKKTVIFVLTLLFTVSLTACGSGDKETSLPKEGVIEKSGGVSSESENQQTKPSSDGEKTDSGSKILVAYFTVPETDGVDTVSGASRVAKDGEVLGNTEFVAKEIQKNLGGDLFAIETVQKYPGEHQDLLDFAYDELDKNARPELSGQIENLDSYDMVLVGYPIWWSDMPQIMYTFFDTYNLKGKNIIPFCTHAGSGLSGTVGRIKKLEPQATVYKGLAIYRTDVTDSDSKVKSWIKKKAK